MTAPQTRLTPARQRLEALDALRGFALLGVLIVNVYQSHSLRLSPADGQTARLIALLAEGSFYPLFSLLFGLGFALQLGRGLELARFRRRLGVLLAFGLAHGVLVWHGDILASYALVGFALPALERLGNPRLLLVAAALYALTFALFAALVPGGELPHAQDIAQAASYLEALPLRSARYLANLVNGLLLFGGQLLGLFALGLWLGRRGPARLLGNTRLLLTTLGACLALALPILALRGNSGVGEALESLVASPLLGLAYLCAMALLLLRVRLPMLAAVGRMALSNYLAQSIIATLLFYNYGLGLYGSVGTLGGLGLAFGIFAAQLLFSWLWLKAFRYGPAEWLWRSLSYGQPQPMRDP